MDGDDAQTVDSDAGDELILLLAAEEQVLEAGDGDVVLARQLLADLYEFKAAF